jgi:chromosome partitioning protein
MEIISFANQKGGVGKTTTALNVGAGLTELGYKVLLIDVDPSANLTFSLGHKGGYSKSLFHFLAYDEPFDEVVIHDERGFDLIPSEKKLDNANIALAGEMEREKFLYKRIQAEISPTMYDYILLDCMPSAGLLPVNAITASNRMIVVLQSQELALEGLEQMILLFKKIQGINPDIVFEGIVATLYDNRERLPREVVKELTEYFSDKLYKAVIRRNTKVAEAPREGKTIFQHDPKSYGAEDYMALAKEIHSRIHNPKQVTA